MVNNFSGISVLMPTYNQAQFILRALESLRLQTFQNWKLYILNDNSDDKTEEKIKEFIQKYPELKEKINYTKQYQNKGLGASLNSLLNNAEYQLIAYLPSDDIYYKDHLQSLYNTLTTQPKAILAYSGIRHHYNKYAQGKIENESLQLVQILHKKTHDVWTERQELVTDNVNKMFWDKLKQKGEFVQTDNITAEWVDHPNQMHKIIREPLGGINPYKLKYKVNHPLRFHSTVGNYIDEYEHYKQFRKPTQTTQNKLKIILVGELAYNADRIYALEEKGHELYGLWIQDPYWYNTVGPLPFGNIKDLSPDNWQEEIEKIKPDIIYALLNWQAVPLAHQVLQKTKNKIPFIWHFKEGPFICMEKGTWPQLIELYAQSNGQIYTSPEMRDWFEQFIYVTNSLILDGDLPKKEWFTNTQSPLLSDKDNQIHTVVPGRPIGLHPETVKELGEHNIHLHFYGDFTHGQWASWIEKTKTLAEKYIHIHPNVDQENWTEEFSKYDAGWLHFFQSQNNKEWMKANWDDLNYPARMATLAVAGVPMIQYDNSEHIVATQTLIQEMEIGVFFKDIADLAQKLKDKNQMQKLRQTLWQKRLHFAFDTHVNTLIEFFRKTIAL